jgi:hypothetical protein
MWDGLATDREGGAIFSASEASLAFQNEHRFSISIKGERTGELWVGDFKSKILLSHADDLARDARRREMLGQTNPEIADADTRSRANILSDLMFRLTDAPVWWRELQNGAALFDNDPIVAVYNSAIEGETKHLLAMKEKAEADRKALLALEGKKD